MRFLVYSSCARSVDADVGDKVAWLFGNSRDRRRVLHLDGRAPLSEIEATRDAHGPAIQDLYVTRAQRDDQAGRVRVGLADLEQGAARGEWSHADDLALDRA